MTQLKPPVRPKRKRPYGHFSMHCRDELKARFVQVAAILRARGRARTMEAVLELALDALVKSEKVPTEV